MGFSEDPQQHVADMTYMTHTGTRGVGRIHGRAPAIDMHGGAAGAAGPGAGCPDGRHQAVQPPL